LKLLPEYGCQDIVLMQPEKRSKKKTDRRDANQLNEAAARQLGLRPKPRDFALDANPEG